MEKVMERPSQVMLSISTILLRQASNCYDKYGKYVKWGAFGFVTLCSLNFCICGFIDWYRGAKKSSPPADSTEINPSIAGSLIPLVPQRVPPRRPKIFRGLDGPVEFPNLGSQASIEAYVKKHSELSTKYLKTKNFDLATYHSSLLFFIYADPMAYFETNSGYLPEATYQLAKQSLIKLLELVEDQMKKEDSDQLS